MNISHHIYNKIIVLCVLQNQNCVDGQFQDKHKCDVSPSMLFIGQ